MWRSRVVWAQGLSGGGRPGVAGVHPLPQAGLGLVTESRKSRAMISASRWVSEVSHRAQPTHKQRRISLLFMLFFFEGSVKKFMDMF